MHDLNLENVVKEPTCFKSDNPTCIDLILTSDKKVVISLHSLRLRSPVHSFGLKLSTFGMR